MTSLLLEPPLFGESLETGLPVVVIAVDFTGASTIALISDSDGNMSTCSVDKLRSDWRYDHQRNEWYDASVKAQEKMTSDG